MRISVNQLQKDMLIDENVYNTSGSLIINRGFSVKNPLILKNMLIQNGIESVNVLVLSDAFADNSPEEISVDQSINNEIENFKQDFNNKTDLIKNKLLEIQNGSLAVDDFSGFLDDSIRSLQETYLNVFQLMQKVNQMDDQIFSHCYKVSLTSHALGKWMNMKGEELQLLSLAGLLADIGKVKIDKDILNKKDALSADDMENIKHHTDYALEILSTVPMDYRVVEAIHYHHERMDGSGYPEGLSGEKIPLFSKIIALADIYIALTSNRPHRPAYTPFDAIHILERDFKQTLDIQVLSSFLNHITKSYIGNPITLSNGEMGKIIFMNPTNYARPLVQLDSSDEILDMSQSINKDIQISAFN